MAFTHGSKAKISIDNAAGSLQDLSPYISNISFPTSLDLQDASVLGNTFKTYVVGMSDGTISVEGRYDPVSDAHFDGLRAAGGSLTGGGTITVRYDPQGSTSTLPRFTTEAFLTSYEVSTGVDGIASWSAEFQCSGAITRTTI
jgi:hypothetical protein